MVIRPKKLASFRSFALFYVALSLEPLHRLHIVGLDAPSYGCIQPFRVVSSQTSHCRRVNAGAAG